MYIRGRGTYRRQHNKFSQSSHINKPAGVVSGDARDKLISSRRPITDARTVIRQQTVSKVGDLRSVLPRKRPLQSKRGRGGSDLRQTLRTSAGLKNGAQVRGRPELVYADEVVPKKHYKGPGDTNVTVGRGGRVTISRRRGRSIDKEREAEKVQPTGIPAHMRRQPSPVPRPARSPSPQRRQMSSAQHTRPQSFIVAPKDTRGSRPSQPGHREQWSAPGPAGEVFEYRRRSRSPIDRGDRMPSGIQFAGNMRGFRSRSKERVGGQAPPLMYLDQRQAPRQAPISQERWEMALAPLFADGRALRSEYQQPQPLFVREQRQAQPYGSGYTPQSVPYQPSLRMDRPIEKKPAPRQMPLPTSNRRAHGAVMKVAPLKDVQLPAPQQMYYCIKVTSLSHEVSEDDVVELFSDIGPLVSAKLVTKGHAEVCFVHKKDAKTAIEKYDRRELDGIPMNLKLIEKSTSGRVK